jgi:outer membrane protein assembly factor BamB
MQKNYCLSSFFSEPETGCISWNRYESAGPLLNENEIYIGGSDNKLHILSASTGLIQKRISLPGKLKSKPTLIGNTLLLGTDQGYLISFNTETWEPNWQQKLDAELPNSVLIAGDQVYVVSGLATLYALDLKTGDIIWEQTRPLSVGLGLKTLSNPLILNDQLIIGNPSGKLDFIRLADGELLFDIQIGDAKKPFPNVATDPILLDNDQIAVAGFNQGLAVLDTQGVILWTVPHLSNVTQLAFDGQLLIAAAPGQVTAIHLQTQKKAWSFKYTKGSPNKLIVKNGYVYFGSDQDALYVLDLKTGKPLQILGSGLGFAADFDFSSDDALFALSTAGYLYHYGRKTNPSCCGFN